MRGSYLTMIEVGRGQVVQMQVLLVGEDQDHGRRGGQMMVVATSQDEGAIPGRDQDLRRGSSGVLLHIEIETVTGTEIGIDTSGAEIMLFAILPNSAMALITLIAVLERDVSIIQRDQHQGLSSSQVNRATSEAGPACA